MTADAPAETVARQRRAVRHGGYALVSSTMLTSLTGVAYWWAAARGWSTDRVGQTAALVSSMALVAEIASLGMTTGLVRHLPLAGGWSRNLILRAYALALALALALSATGLLVLGLVTDDLPTADRALAIWFVLGSGVWVLFVMQDGVLVGLGRATAVPVQNALFGVGRVALLVVVAATAARTTTALYLTWIIPTAVCVAVVTALVVRNFTSGDAGVAQPGLYQSTVRFSIVNHVAAMLQRVWPMAMPVTVLWVLGAEASSHAFIAWSSAYALWLIPAGTGQALLAEASRTPALLHRLTGTALGQTMRLTVLGAAATVAVAPWYLAMFGGDYADGGTALLRLLAVAAIPKLVTELYLSAQRSRGALRPVLLVQAALGLPMLMFAVPILRWHGLNGLGVLWLVNHALVAAIVLVRGRWDLWIPSLTPGMVDALAHIGRRRTRRPATARVPSTHGAMTVGTIEAVGGVVVKRADGTAAVERLCREAAALRSIRADAALAELHPFVPEVVALALDHEQGQLVVTEMPGVQAGAGDVVMPDRIAELTATMHVATSRPTLVGADEIGRWVVDRIEVLSPMVRTIAPGRCDALARLGDELAGELEGAALVVGTIHGDLSPSNVLVDDSTGRITALIDWELAGFGEPIVIDLVQLLLAFPVARGEAELGQLVAETLAFGWSAEDRALFDRHAPACGGPPIAPAVLQLTWLRHVWANLVKNPGYGHHQIWVVRNVLPVLDLVGTRA